MKDWHKLKPDLFKKQPYHLPGCDIVWVPARGMGTLRLSKPRRDALDDGRLTVISPFPEDETRTNADHARQRNRVVEL